MELSQLNIYNLFKSFHKPSNRDKYSDLIKIKFTNNYEINMNMTVNSINFYLHNKTINNIVEWATLWAFIKEINNNFDVDHLIMSITFINDRKAVRLYDENFSKNILNSKTASEMKDIIKSYSKDKKFWGVKTITISVTHKLHWLDPNE